MLLLDDEPPYASFATHSVDGLRSPFSKVYDRRWHEAVLSAVNADEEMKEKRKKLTARRAPLPATGEGGDAEKAVARGRQPPKKVP